MKHRTHGRCARNCGGRQAISRYSIRATQLVRRDFRTDAGIPPANVCPLKIRRAIGGAKSTARGAGMLPYAQSFAATDLTQGLVIRLIPGAQRGERSRGNDAPSTSNAAVGLLPARHDAPITKARRRGAALGRQSRAVQLSTLYFLNHAIISFHASSAASLR